MGRGLKIAAAVAATVALAVAGEFVGAARRRVLRREVGRGAPPAPAPGQILVRVTGADGRPIPQARLAQVVIPSRPGAPTRQFLGMSAGYVFLAAPEAGDDAASWLEVHGPADTADEELPFGAVRFGPLPRGRNSLEVVLPPERTLSGTIRRDGLPVPGVKVKARMAPPQEFAAVPSPGNDVWHGIGSTGEDGSYLVGRLGEGEQEVSFETPRGIALADRRAGTGTVLDIEAGGPGTPVVRILTGEGRPLANAGVFVREAASSPGQAGRVLARGLTDPRGEIRIQGLPPGAPLRLEVTRPGGADGTPAEVREWTPSDATVRLGLLRSVRVQVLDEAGAPHAGARVLLTRGTAGAATLSATVDTQGWCRFSGIESGPVSVAALDICGLRKDRTLAPRAVAEGEQEVRLVLPRGACLEVGVVGAAPGGGPRAFLREEKGMAADMRPVRAGSAQWHGLDADATYAVLLVDLQGRRAARLEGLRAGGPGATATLAPAVVTRVFVRWPKGAVERRVDALWGHVVAAQGGPQPDGTWLLACLPPGKVRIRATCKVMGEAGGRSAEAEAETGGDAEIQVR